MAHPDEGLIQTFLDGEMDEPEERELREHLEGCPECRSGLEGQRAFLTTAAGALAPLDSEPDLGVARAQLQVRLQTRVQEGAGSHSSLPTSNAPTWRRNLTLPRAASIALLLTGAAATALPGSPARRWMAQGWDQLRGGPVQDAEESAATQEVRGGQDEPTTSTPAGLAETGASIPSSEEGVELWVQDLSEGAEVRVVWVEGDQAGIFGQEGTLYRREANRLEAQGPPGSVRIEIPRSFSGTVIGVNGRIILRKSGESLEVLGPVLSRTESEIRFGPFPPSGEPGG